MKKLIKVMVFASVISSVIIAPSVSAADLNLKQQIRPNHINVYQDDEKPGHVLDGTPLTTAPKVRMSDVLLMNQDVQSAGTYGKVGSRIIVDNPGVTNNWSLTLSMKSSNDVWKSADNHTFEANGDPSTGVMTIDASGSMLTNITGSVSGTIIFGSPVTFNKTNYAVDIARYSGATNQFWRGAITGIQIKQYVPKKTPAGTYKINLVQTLTSI